MQCAPFACVSCAQKKRKCDRLLPACSRCSEGRTKEHCWYNVSSQSIGEQGPVITIVSCRPPKAGMACGQCRSQKRACNRALPSCARCEMHHKKCVYNTVPASKRTSKSIDPTCGGGSTSKTHLRTLYGPGIQIDYPVRDSTYIPGLIHHFCSVCILPATVALPNSLARHVQSTWMRSALSDPCLFHSTLFSASAHMDGLQGIANNPRTICHQLQAVKLLRERLRQPQFRVNYEAIGTVLGLGFFDMVIKNVDGVQAHSSGLMQMLATSYDQGPETESLMGLANMTHFTRSMVSNTDALFLPCSSKSGDGIQPVNPLSGIPPSRFLCRILARASAGKHNQASTVFTPETVMDLISTASTVAQYAKMHELSTEATMIPILGADALRRASFPFDSKQGPVTKNMNKCVHLAAKICRNILLTTLTLTTTTAAADVTNFCLRDDIEVLKTSLRKIDFISWLQHAPEAYAWVCFTAAAACFDNESDWTSFILTPMPVLTALDSADLRALREGWAYLKWLRGVFSRVA
ncbi:hypothetical protein BJX63DRAFT_371595 [Aspergillus granulosus]|uniref:Zn(2)-C6 fungal-type domain-containing protein n=1 Tax=Aspergillus granulosus TaxID=176169 RepID=A0ABR4H1N1_9EURO